jgi:hypothetical protein
MKNLLLLTLIFATLNSHAQNVGIGTNSPQKRLHVRSADSIAVQVEGTDLNSSTAAVGISIRPTSNVSFEWMALKGRLDAFVVNSGRLRLNRRYDNEVSTVLFVDEYGRVGIGGAESDLEYQEPAKLNILQKGVAGAGIFLEAPFVRDGIVIKGLTSTFYPNPASQKISAIRFGFNQFQNSRITLENMGSSVNPLLSFEMYNAPSFAYEKVLTLDRTGIIMNKSAGINENLTVGNNLSVYNNATIFGNLNAGTTRPFVDVDMPSNFIKEIFCACPNGLKAIGGGGGHRDYNTAAQDIKINYSGPDPADDTKWKVIATNTNATQLRAVRVYAICSRLQ